MSADAHSTEQGRKTPEERESQHSQTERWPQLRDRSVAWVRKNFLRNLTSIYPLTIMKSIKKKKKKVEMPSPFEGKRVLLLYKAASLCFDTPLFELSSLAGRVSDSPAVGHSVCGERSCETPSPCVESKLSVSG